MKTETVVMKRFNINIGTFDSVSIEMGMYSDSTIYVQSPRGYSYPSNYNEAEKLFNAEIGHYYRLDWR